MVKKNNLVVVKAEMPKKLSTQPVLNIAKDVDMVAAIIPGQYCNNTGGESAGALAGCAPLAFGSAATTSFSLDSRLASFP